MRTIKFRAKSIDGYWVSGDLHLQCKYPHIHTAERRSVPIDPTTIGQFTGLTDKNGKEIYEGDIISSKKHPQIKHLIFYNEKQGKFMAGLYGKTNIDYFGVCGVDNPSWMAEKEVVGDIHDNPELLKGGQDD